LANQLNLWKAEQKYPPGHYYSPVPSGTDIDRVATKSSRFQSDEIPGIDLNWAEQELVFRERASYCRETPFGDNEQNRSTFRYYFENGFYSYTDGILLFAILRFLRPKRLIEIGSGFSSCLMLDVNEHWLEGAMNLTFIEPYPERLEKNLKKNDEASVTILRKPVQDVPLDQFRELTEGDVLFIDSSHVGKAGSDVNFLFFEVLPQLSPGVWVHIHDVFYPFEYPMDWLTDGRSWNEAYLLRCLLTHSSDFKIRIWGNALCVRRPELVKSLVPKCFENTGAGIWLQKTTDASNASRVHFVANLQGR
jgi:hypothetical protein